jgi:hypothetical protein
MAMSASVSCPEDNSKITYDAVGWHAAASARRPSRKAQYEVGVDKARRARSCATAWMKTSQVPDVDHAMIIAWTQHRPGTVGCRSASSH